MNLMEDLNAPRILLIEDEEAIAVGVVFNLTRKGYRVDHANNGRVGYEWAQKNAYDLIVLDLRLPEMNGFDVCAQLRQQKIFTPIIMLTARDQSDDRIHGLKLGADDYMTKPFDLAELLTRIEVKLRRQQWQMPLISPETSSSRFEFGDFWVDFSSYQAKTRQGVVDLSPKEIGVLKIFVGRPGHVIKRRELLEKVWELPDHPNTRVVDNVIVSLRKAFEEDSQHPKHIHQVRGAGYKFTISS